MEGEKATSNVQSSETTQMAVAEDYSEWSHSDLVKRVLELEKSMTIYAQAQKSSEAPTPQAPIQTKAKISKKASGFNFSRYSTRLIALKFAYFGTPFQGFEYHGGETLLPTVEEKLFEALLKARLVEPKRNITIGPDGEEIVEVEPTYKSGGWNLSADNVEGGLWRWLDMDKWQYTKCGRTDKGVSAFSQVVALKVVSCRPKAPEPELQDDNAAEANAEEDAVGSLGRISKKEARPFDDVKDEHDYVGKLNTLLPPSIRILAWCPDPPEDFSARFDCRGRTYRYYFTNPVFPPGLDKGGNRLDIEKMREGAKHYEGVHDFRNFCKLDPSKQITNFVRRIFSASIEKVEPLSPQYSVIKQMQVLEGGDEGDIENGETVTTPELYYFKVEGTAFLWNQIRHMVAILFLIGQKLESPDLIPRMLDVANVKGRPAYELADDRPLVLWDCKFDKEKVKWVYPELRMRKYRPSDLIGAAWGAWHSANMDATLAAGLLGKIYEDSKLEGVREIHQGWKKKKVDLAQSIVDGSPFARSTGKYIPIMERKRLEPVEIANEKYAAKKGEAWAKKWSADARRKRRDMGGEGFEDYDDE